MCRLLDITRSLVYYTPSPHKVDTTLENAVIEEFKTNYESYGTRKLKRALMRRETPLRASRKRIGKIMDKYGLVSKYIRRRKKKSSKERINEEALPNLVERKFDGRKPLEVVASDLTYIKVSGKWHYACLLVDVGKREIVGHAAGRNKDAKLVRKAFYRADIDLRSINIFHTDRGSEFKNEIVDGILHAFGMKRSLSAKGSPYDNAVMESLYNAMKTEMVFGATFDTLDELELALFQFVNWYNNRRLHGSLNYLPPREYNSPKEREKDERKLSKKG